uniref:Uncharacterized protein n=1 Tax=Sinocyclocheilus anshuiensis TaxID=1608454 RepID=A0A671M8P1_9TELE
MKGIIPKNKTKGTDFCGVKDYYFIIRSDLGCYMQSSNFNKGLDITIFSLHPACQNGDHYLGQEDGYFYIIKGTSYRRVIDLSTDSGAVVYSLHPNCQEWGVEYYKGTNFNKDECVDVYSVHPDVINVLPGGLSVTKGPAFGIWEDIKTITNDSITPVTWQKRINKKVGYNKEKMSQITHNWKIATSASTESGALSGLIAKCQFSFSAEYGGSHVSTENESWNEATEYKLGLGQEPVLFCRDLMIDDEPNPPAKIPLPPAQT